MRQLAALLVGIGLSIGFAQQRGGRGATPPFHPNTEEIAKIQAKSEQLESLLEDLRAKRVDAALLGDVAVYAKAGRFLLEYQELVANQGAIDHAIVVLDQGIERARQLAAGEAQW